MMNKAPDLIDQMEQLSTSKLRESTHVQINSLISDLDDNQKLVLFRELVLEQIYKMIDKFPEVTQKEMLAKMTHKYLSEWNEKK